MEALRQWQQQRRNETLEAVSRAVNELKSEGKPVNFRSVSALSGLTRKTLYSVPEAKLLILGERKEDPQTQPDRLIARQAAQIYALEQEIARLKNSLYLLRSKISF
ncbi:MAG: DUF6262 family protein [Campylobacterales bacterium]